MAGHQEREGISWPWVSQALRELLRGLPAPIEGFSCLAVGADQVFARAVLDVGGEVVAVVPHPGYERHFSGDGLLEYERLLGESRIVRLDSCGDDEVDFMEAGRFIVSEADLLVAIWDGKPSRGLGGTADVAGQALESGVPVHHINPISQTSRGLQ